MPWLTPPAGGRFTATNVPLKLLIGLGWPQRISGGPSWVFTDGYDISAKEPGPAASDDEFSLMMQNLLKDRFGLRVHTETHEARVYILTPAKNGLKLPDAKSEPWLLWLKYSACRRSRGMRRDERYARLDRQRKGFDGVVRGLLGGLLGRPVVNRTGFTGSFKVHLEFAPVAPTRDSESTKPSIFAALGKQLGLKLESQKGTEEVLVIDHVEKPSEN